MPVCFVNVCLLFVFLLAALFERRKMYIIPPYRDGAAVKTACNTVAPFPLDGTYFAYNGLPWGRGYCAVTYNFVELNVDRDRRVTTISQTSNQVGFPARNDRPKVFLQSTRTVTPNSLSRHLK